MLVGGPTAEAYDYRKSATRDNFVVLPLALLVVLLILAILLRALLAPLLLVASVILSFFAALGTGIFFFEHVFGFAGVDPSLPLLAFVFLVALGIDYNIFLMARVREETLRHGTRVGMLRGLAVTGAVITSAGIVLAGTFSALAVLPLVFLTEIGFIIAFGVLLDTFLVRSVLVPALVFDIGPRIWWPSALQHEDHVECGGGRRRARRARHEGARLASDECPLVAVGRARYNLLMRGGMPDSRASSAPWLRCAGPRRRAPPSRGSSTATPRAAGEYPAQGFLSSTLPTARSCAAARWSATAGS